MLTFLFLFLFYFFVNRATKLQVTRFASPQMEKHNNICVLALNFGENIFHENIFLILLYIYRYSE